MIGRARKHRRIRTTDSLPVSSDGEVQSPARQSVGTLSQLRVQELDWLRRLQLWRRGLRRNHRRVLDLLVDASPLRDLSMFVWLGFFLGLPVLGFRLYWGVLTHVCACLVLARLTMARVPWAFDASLRVRRRMSPNGFPCIELWLGVVVLFSLCVRVRDPLLITGTVVYLLGLSASRLYAATHFPHQIVLTLLCSVVSWAAAMPLEAILGRMGPRTAPGRLALAVLPAVVVVGVLMHRAERNDSFSLAVPRSEFMRLLRSILLGDAAPPAAQERAGPRLVGGAGATSGASLAEAADALLQRRMAIARLRRSIEPDKVRERQRLEEEARQLQRDLVETTRHASVQARRGDTVAEGTEEGDEKEARRGNGPKDSFVHLYESLRHRAHRSSGPGR